MKKLKNHPVRTFRRGKYGKYIPHTGTGEEYADRDTCFLCSKRRSSSIDARATITLAVAATQAAFCTRVGRERDTHNTVKTACAFSDHVVLTARRPRSLEDASLFIRLGPPQCTSSPLRWYVSCTPRSDVFLERTRRT